MWFFLQRRAHSLYYVLCIQTLPKRWNLIWNQNPKVAWVKCEKFRFGDKAVSFDDIHFCMMYNCCGEFKKRRIVSGDLPWGELKQVHCWGNLIISANALILTLPSVNVVDPTIFVIKLKLYRVAWQIQSLLCVHLSLARWDLIFCHDLESFCQLKSRC